MVKQEMTRLADKIDVSYDDLPKINEYNYIGTPFILQHSSHFEYVIQEGNDELERGNYFSIDSLLYAVFSDITRKMASDYELANRIGSQDSRIILFTKQVELMKRLNPIWGETLKTELNKILEF